MTFSEALEEMKKGKKIYRTCWGSETYLIIANIEHIYLMRNEKIIIINPSFKTDDILSEFWKIAP